MSEYVREQQLKKKREYYKRWRANNPDKVKASQAKYWTRKAEESRSANNDQQNGGTNINA